MKKWLVTAELNMDASNYESVVVKANTERKARIFADEKFRKVHKAFFITNMTVKQVE